MKLDFINLSPAEIQFLFGAGFALVALFIAIWLIGYGWLRGGETVEQTRHRKTVKKSMKKLSKTEPATYDSPSGLEADIRYLCGTRRRGTIVQRLRHRLRLPARAPSVRAMPCPDADGATFYVVSIGGHRLANRYVDQLVEDAQRVGPAIADGDDPPPTVSEYYYHDCLKGLVDYHDTEQRVAGDCLTRIKSNVREQQELEEAKLINRCIQDFRYPPSLVREKIDQLEGRSIRRTKDGTLVWKRY